MTIQLVSLTSTFVGCELLGGKSVPVIEVEHTHVLLQDKKKILKNGGIYN